MQFFGKAFFFRFTIYLFNICYYQAYCLSKSECVFFSEWKERDGWSAGVNEYYFPF